MRPGNPSQIGHRTLEHRIGWARSPDGHVLKLEW